MRILQRELLLRRTEKRISSGNEMIRHKPGIASTPTLRQNYNGSLRSILRGCFKYPGRAVGKIQHLYQLQGTSKEKSPDCVTYLASTLPIVNWWSVCFQNAKLSLCEFISGIECSWVQTSVCTKENAFLLHSFLTEYKKIHYELHYWQQPHWHINMNFRLS